MLVIKTVSGIEIPVPARVGGGRGELTRLASGELVFEDPLDTVDREDRRAVGRRLD